MLAVFANPPPAISTAFPSLVHFWQAAAAGAVTPALAGEFVGNHFHVRLLVSFWPIGVGELRFRRAASARV